MLMNKQALLNFQAELVQRRIELEAYIENINIGFDAKSDTEVAHKTKILLQANNKLQVIEYFIEQADTEVFYVEQNTNTYVNPFLSNINTKNNENISTIETIDAEHGEG